MICWPRGPEAPAAMMRAAKSDPPPGVLVTMRMVLLGKSCAAAEAAARLSNAITDKLTREMAIIFPLMRWMAPGRRGHASPRRQRAILTFAGCRATIVGPPRIPLCGLLDMITARLSDIHFCVCRTRAKDEIRAHPARDCPMLRRCHEVCTQCCFDDGRCRQHLRSRRGLWPDLSQQAHTR